MIRRIHQSLKDFQGRLGTRYGSDISTPQARRAAWWHFQLSDHAFLRGWWTNLREIAPGVYRSNQPSPARMTAMRKLGLRTILNLRGQAGQSFWLFERESAAAQGIVMIDLGMSAKRAPMADALLTMLDLFRSMEKPVLIHCKSGADRTGLAAALYLIDVEGRPVAEAARQLSWRTVHRSSGPTGILDHFLRVYGRAQSATGISLRDWIETGYDPAELTASYVRYQAKGKDGPW